jgi:hypothetical protein
MKLRFNGPDGQVSREVGAETGNGDVLEPGSEITVSTKLGERLLASSSQWEPVEPPKKKPAKGEEA